MHRAMRRTYNVSREAMAQRRAQLNQRVCALHAELDALSKQVRCAAAAAHYSAVLLLSLGCWCWPVAYAFVVTMWSVVVPPTNCWHVVQGVCCLCLWAPQKGVGRRVALSGWVLLINISTSTTPSCCVHASCLMAGAERPALARSIHCGARRLQGAHGAAAAAGPAEPGGGQRRVQARGNAVQHAPASGQGRATRRGRRVKVRRAGGIERAFVARKAIAELPRGLCVSCPSALHFPSGWFGPSVPLFVLRSLCCAALLRAVLCCAAS